MKLNIGENIRRRRREAGLTQEELGDALGVSFQAVSRWENGTSYPDIEVLPTLAKYFGISVDALLGYGGERENSRLGGLLRAFSAESSSETPDPECVIGILREMRRDYLSSVDAHFWWEARTLYRLPGVLPELRMTAEAILERCTEKKVREEAVYYMSQYEDDEHIWDFLEKYGALYDLTFLNLCFERHKARGEREQHEDLRQLRLNDMIVRLTGDAFLRLDRALTVDERMQVNTFQLDLLNWLCGIRPTDEHPVFCDGVVDEWSALRVRLGSMRAGYLASTGDTEGAFAVMEDVVSMLEKIVRQIDEADGGVLDVPVRCPWLDRMDLTLHRTFFVPRGRRLLMGWWKIGPKESYAGDYDVPFVPAPGEEEEDLKWFDPIRDDPRYRMYVDRVMALDWSEEYRALYLHAMAQKDLLVPPDACMVCMLSEKGNLYHLSFPVASECKSLLSALFNTVPEQDRVMSAMLCFLSPGWALEIPSFAFRNALLQLDEANQKALIYMNGQGGIIEKTLAQTMPPSVRK